MARGSPAGLRRLATHRLDLIVSLFICLEVMKSNVERLLIQSVDSLVMLAVSTKPAVYHCFGIIRLVHAN